MTREFAVFILTHGRPNNQITYRRLLANGYPGRVYLVVDDEDPTRGEYLRNFGDDVIVFSKRAYEGTFDVGDLERTRRGVIYARNAVFDLAADLGLTHFLVLDDDYSGFYHRFIEGSSLRSIGVSDYASLFDLMLDFLDESGALSVCFAQGGDLIGGALGGKYAQRLLRKAMNAFFCRVDRRFHFVGRINEDVNTYTTVSNRGGLFFTVVDVVLVQQRTQKQAGGMTELYLDFGTYLKSFYSVVYQPQAVKLAMMGCTWWRIHHTVDWNACAPKILSEKWKKRA